MRLAGSVFDPAVTFASAGEDAYAAVMAVSEKDVKLLWGRGAERCAFPDCRKVLSKTPETASPGYPLGKQAHIVSHAPGGVRTTRR